MAEETNLIKEQALAYAKAGWWVFPLHTPQGSRCSCGQTDCNAGKHPRISNWQYDASSDPAAVAGWWETWPNANVGLRLDNLLVLDVDGAEGLQSSLERAYDPLLRIDGNS